MRRGDQGRKPPGHGATLSLACPAPPEARGCRAHHLILRGGRRIFPAAPSSVADAQEPGQRGHRSRFPSGGGHSAVQRFRAPPACLPASPSPRFAPNGPREPCKATGAFAAKEGPLLCPATSDSMRKLSKTKVWLSPHGRHGARGQTRSRAPLCPPHRPPPLVDLRLGVSVSGSGSRDRHALMNRSPPRSSSVGAAVSGAGLRTRPSVPGPSARLLG